LKLFNTHNFPKTHPHTNADLWCAPLFPSHIPTLLWCISIHDSTRQGQRCSPPPCTRSVPLTLKLFAHSARVHTLVSCTVFCLACSLSRCYFSSLSLSHPYICPYGVSAHEARLFKGNLRGAFFCRMLSFCRPSAAGRKKQKK